MIYNGKLLLSPYAIGCFLICTFSLLGQSDVDKFKQYYMIAKKNLSVNLDSSEFYIKKARQQITVEEHPGFIIDCALLESSLANKRSDPNLSRQILEDHLSIFDRNDLPLHKSKVLMFLGIDHKRKREYDEAVIKYEEALEIAMSIPDSMMISSITYSLATIYELNNNLEKAIETYQQSMDIDVALDREVDIASTLLNLSLIYEKLNNYDQAEKSIREALVLIDKYNLQNSNIIAHINLGSLLIDVGKFQEAVHPLTKADSLMKAMNYTSKAYFHSIYMNLAISHNNLKAFDEAIKFVSKILDDEPENYNHIKALSLSARIYANLGNCVVANQYINKIDPENVEELFPDEKFPHYKYLSEIYELCNNQKKAYEYLKLAYEQRDSVYIETDKQNAIDADTKYQASIKERENEKLKFDNNLQLAQLQTQKAYLYGGGLSLLVLSIMLFFLNRVNQKRKLLNLELSDSNKKIQLLHREALHRNQNQLALATSLIAMQKSQATNKDPMEIIKDSERKLRTIAAVNKKLSNQDRDKVAKLNEIIEEIVSGNIFSMAFKDIKLNLNIEDVVVTPEQLSALSLITNELSTNSIKHAFEKTTDPEIYIDLYQQNNSVCFNYRDNGQVTHDPQMGGGTQLINGLIDQLNARYSIETKPSYQLRVEIPYL